MRVGPLQVHLTLRELSMDGQPVRIGSRAFDILEQLILAEGKLVSKDELIRRVWPDTVVEENNLQVHMSSLRKLLGDSRSMIKTVPGRGYRLSVDKETEEPVAATVNTARPPFSTNLPAQSSALIGRDDALLAVADLLQSSRQVTLVGAGGIGKTRLAIEAARALQARFRDGVFLVSLATATDLPMALEALSKAIGMTSFGAPASVARILQELGAKNRLLVLDNCEHILTIAAELAEGMTQNNPNAAILATSREALRTADEIVFSVPPLTIPDKSDQSHEVLQCSAVKLFLARARAVDPGFAMDAQSLFLTGTVCRRLDGIPLAMELAAARAAVLGIHTLAAHLDDRFRMLTGGHRTALPRHQTLKATLDWSYALLNETEQILLRRLGIFVNGFTVFDAPSVACAEQLDEAQIIDALTGLVAKSLVVAEAGGRARRYRLIETTRAYALQKLTDHGEERQVAASHARYLRDKFQARTSAPASCGTRLPEVDFEHDIDDLRAALKWTFSPKGDAALGVALAAASVDRFYDASLVGECREWSQRAIQAMQAPPSGAADAADAPAPAAMSAMSAMRMRLLAGFAASTVYATGPTRETRDAWSDVLSIAITLGERDVEARALWGLWNAAQYAGEACEALRLAHRFATLAAHTGDATNQLLSLRLLGIAQHYAGDQQAARAHLEQMLALYAHSDYCLGMQLGKTIDQGVVTRATLARVRWLQGERESGLAVAESAVATALSAGHDMTTCYVLVEALIPLTLLSGKRQRAASSIALLLETAIRAGLTIWQACAQGYEACLHCIDDPSNARLDVFSSALRHLEGFGYLAPHALLAGQYALALGRAGRVVDGMDTVDTALRTADTHGERWYASELRRIQGELILLGVASGTGLGCTESDAEACFGAALEEALRQGTRTFQLRAATSLARMWKSRGRCTDVASLLMPVCSGLSEGRDFDDYHAAAALMSQDRSPKLAVTLWI